MQVLHVGDLIDCLIESLRGRVAGPFSRRGRWGLEQSSRLHSQQVVEVGWNSVYWTLQMASSLPSPNDYGGPLATRGLRRERVSPRPSHIL